MKKDKNYSKSKRTKIIKTDSQESWLLKLSDIHFNYNEYIQEYE